MKKYEITIIRLAEDYSMEQVKDVVYENTPSLNTAGILRLFVVRPELKIDEGTVRGSVYRPGKHLSFITFEPASSNTYNNSNELTQQQPNSMIIFREI